MIDTDLPDGVLTDTQRERILANSLDLGQMLDSAYSLGRESTASLPEETAMNAPEFGLTDAVDAAARALLETDGFTANAEPSNGLFTVHEDNIVYIAKAVIEAALPHLLAQIKEEIALAIEAQAKEMRDYGKRLGWVWTDSSKAKDAGYHEAASVARNVDVRNTK